MDKTSHLPFKVSIVMQRQTLSNRWQSLQWQLLDVLPDVPGPSTRQLRASEQEMHWLFAGFEIVLYADEAPGYFLNLSSDAPCWFVMWRLEEFDGQEIAIPKSITLSYNEAARWMDGSEQVDTLPVASDIASWLAEYTQEYYEPEVKKKRKHPSFEGGVGVDKMARAELNRGRS
ncbi:DUF3305 domain-containing protein [Undibacterium sp. Jales W-56]|uniref:DUF3305 domain-containing protein n=1 Tax=Undibacterium sp. Jales W-56 TaxID=2897325 RepID=UPI0021CE1679|nr:DUF3305 domain-containing protein [Undibacterium sp. Jales W-56]MCU6432897.1 DUF3305 domain-containing protein [Undibacterium sp. Jales W-56]